MGTYSEVRGIVIDVLSDQEWHTTEELQRKCEESGIMLNGERHSIYNAVHRLKKRGKIEGNGAGRYRMVIENTEVEDEIGCDTEKVIEGNNIEQAILNIEKLLKFLTIYKNFDWINCSDEECRNARKDARRLLALADKINTGFEGKL